MDGKRTHLSLLAAMNGHPFCMTEPALWMIATLASREVVSVELLREYQRLEAERPPTAFMGSPGSKLQDGSRLRLREKGVGVLAVRGPMIRHADLMDEISGATSMARVANEVQLALNTPEIKSLVLDIESPGGEVPAELADMIRAADAQKPVTAYIGNWGMSAAYWMGTAAGKLVAHKTAFTGSVGVRATFFDTTRIEEAMGIDRIEMMADQSPDKIADPKTPAGKAQIQKMLNAVADDFIDYAARNMNVSRKKVREDFGKGAAVHAARAAEVGMIDGLDTMEGVIAAVGGGRRYKPTAVSVSHPGGVAMPKTMRQKLAEVFGSRLDEVHDDSAESILSSVQDAEATAQREFDELTSVKAALATEKSRADAAEQRERDLKDAGQSESQAAQEREIKAMVQGWVGKKIHPAESAHVEKMALLAADHDRTKQPGQESSLPIFRAMIESRPTLTATDEFVAAGKVPVGGSVVSAPVAPPATPGGPVRDAAGDALQRQIAAQAMGLPHEGNGIIRK